MSFASRARNEFIHGLAQVILYVATSLQPASSPICSAVFLYPELHGTVNYFWAMK